MILIKKKATTAGTRHQLNLQKNLLFKKNFFLKNLLEKKNSKKGHCLISGHTTVWHQGGGCKRLYRKVNFLNINTKSIVIGVLYDPNRSAFIALNFDLIKKVFFNTIALEYTYPGSLIECQKTLNEFRIGYRTRIVKIPSGSVISNIAIKENQRIQYSRSAGTSCSLLQKSFTSSKIRLPSGKILLLSSTAYATIGAVSNPEANKVYIGKAGRNRLKGKRPIVRGIAMNPVDHPHGGQTNGGMPWVTPWGIPTKGKPTVKKRNK